jgi:outer membrane protein OmpA-like peptidoglycan-associated protein
VGAQHPAQVQSKEALFAMISRDHTLAVFENLAFDAWRRPAKVAVSARRPVDSPFAFAVLCGALGGMATLASCSALRQAPQIAMEPVVVASVPARPALPLSQASQLDVSTGVPLVFSLTPTAKTMDVPEADRMATLAPAVLHPVVPTAISIKPSAPFISPEPPSATVTVPPITVRQHTQLEPLSAQPTVVALMGYASGEANVSAANIQRLSEISAVARSAASVGVTGFTDSVGSAQQNEVLARARAQAVRTVLLSQGVPNAKLRLFSCTQCFDQKSPEISRRVEVVVSNKPPQLLSAPTPTVRTPRVAAPSVHVANAANASPLSVKD